MASFFSAKPERPLTGCRVLLVEDTEGTRALYTTLLSRAGAAVVPAADGPAAVAAWDECRKSAAPIHAAILDFDLPGLRGDQVAAKLREAEFRAAILGYTAQTRKDVDRMFADAGCDVVLPKGIDGHGLASAVIAICGRRWAE